jgi:hypothetical protein
LVRLASRGLLGNDITYVHCNTLAEKEFRLIADSGGTASISPEVELQMGHGFLATLKLLQVGVRPSISIDIVTSIAGDMFGAMRTLLLGTRAVVNGEALTERRIVDPLPLTAGTSSTLRRCRARAHRASRPRPARSHPARPPTSCSSTPTGSTSSR